MTKESGAGQWNWQWTATFVVLLGVGASGLLWTRGLQIIASAITVAAVLLGMYVVYKG